MAEIQGKQFNPEKLVKEVFVTDNISSRSDLNPIQIESINKCNTLVTIFGNELLGNHLNDFMTLQLSKDRKSRSEFVDAVKSKMTDIIDKAKTKFSFGG